jgi:hypothetical protein
MVDQTEEYSIKVAEDRFFFSWHNILLAENTGG